MALFDKRDKILGWGFVVLSTVITIMGALWFTSADMPTPFSFLAFTGMMFFIGVLLIGSDWLEHHLSIMDEIEAFPHAVSFHWDQLRQGQPTRAFYMWLTTIFLTMFTAYLIFKYDKWSHTLFLGMSAVIVGLVVGGVLAYVFIGTQWFQMRERETPWWWYIIPAIGILFSAGLGIYFTEPVEYGGPSQWQIDARGQSYDYSHTRIHTGSFFFNTSSSSSSSSGSGIDFSCDEDACIGIIIIAIVIILVIASATTPHFWVAATIILSILLIILSWRDLYPLDNDLKKSQDLE